ncbi:MAG: alpha/beta fold hydrolase [Solobacterium sp.]|nr:alpha/beta fold hydrolase [Solobacterium sp.]
MSERVSIFRAVPQKAVLVVVHGMQEHRGRYAAFAQYLSERGVSVVTFDLPGHGEGLAKEEYGWFGEKDGWQTLVDALSEHVALAKKELGEPVYVIAHSMGSMIVRSWLRDHNTEIAGCILTGAPFYNPAAGVGKVLCRALEGKGEKGRQMLDRIAMSSYSKAVENARTPSDWLSFNEEDVDAFIEDPACGIPFTPRGYYDLLYGLKDMHRTDYKAENSRLPILFLYGKEDPCAGYDKGIDASIKALRKAGYTWINRHGYPHMRHEILQGTGKEEVWNDVIAFTTGRI